MEESKSSSNETSRSALPASDTSRMTDRSVLTATSRTEMSAQPTFRTEMSTARVHTVLAALTAEKQALLAKLNSIDDTLAAEKKRRTPLSKTRK